MANDCNNGVACFSNRCVGSLQFKLVWDGNDDHDIFVTPRGEATVSFANTSSGGCILETGDKIPDTTFDDSSTTVFTEIITCTNPLPGVYAYEVKQFSSWTGNYDPYTLSVYVDGVRQNQATFTMDSGSQTLTLGN